MAKSCVCRQAQRATPRTHHCPPSGVALTSGSRLDTRGRHCHPAIGAEVKPRLVRVQGARRAGEPMHPDREELVRRSVPRHLLETRRGKPRPDLRRQIGRSAGPGPDHGGAGRCQLGDRRHRASYVVVADVAEDAAEQDEIGRNGAAIAGCVTGVCGADLDVRQPGLGGASSSGLGQRGVELDEDHSHEIGIVTVGQDGEYVAAVAGTGAHDVELLRRVPVDGHLVEPVPQVCANDRQPPVQWVVRLGVLLVPVLPVRVVRHRAMVADRAPGTTCLGRSR